jgi:antirestriction protein ArdC
MIQANGQFGSSTQWLTYKQAQSIGAQVRKGAKGVTVVFYKPLQIESDVKGEDGTNGTKIIPMLKTYTVFNADMVDGLPVDETIEEAPVVDEFESIEDCEAFIASSGADIRFGGDGAFYIPSADYIQLPEKTAFNTNADYYATALHELSHWTGHKSRLDRDFSKSKRWGDSAYAFEELVAELSAAMLCSLNHIDGKLQHASYIASWIKVLRDDQRAIFKASAEAQKVLDYLTKEQIETEEQLAA